MPLKIARLEKGNALYLREAGLDSGAGGVRLLFSQSRSPLSFVHSSGSSWSEMLWFSASVNVLTRFSTFPYAVCYTVI